MIGWKKDKYGDWVPEKWWLDEFKEATEKLAGNVDKSIRKILKEVLEK